jgi:hypothetical protein
MRNTYSSFIYVQGRRNETPKGRMDDTEDEIDFANLIELFDNSYYDEDDSDDISLTLPKVIVTQVSE